MISDLIAEDQNGNSDATLLMIEKFKPLLKKCAYKLYYEDAYNDLLVDFIELIRGCGRKPGLKIRVRRRYSHVFI